MNIKAITRAMELSDDDWELTTKLRALSEAERELLMTALGPQKPTAKKSSKKAGKKSARAAGMAATISNSLQRGRGVVTGDGDGPCVKCREDADHNSHHKRTDPNYHPFTPAAQSAEPPSDQAVSETSPGDTGEVHRAAGSGD